MGKLVEPIYNELWTVFSLFGQLAYADRGLCLIGKPPSPTLQEERQVNAARMEKALAKKSKQMTVKAKRGGRLYFDQIDMPVDGRYFDHVIAEYPGATFHLPRGGNARNPIPIKNEGRIVGALMCIEL